MKYGLKNRRKERKRGLSALDFYMKVNFENCDFLSKNEFRESFSILDEFTQFLSYEFFRRAKSI